MPDTTRTTDLLPKHDDILNQVREALRKIAPGAPAFTVLVLDESEDRYAIAATSNMDHEVQREILTACLDSITERPVRSQH